MGKNKLRKFAEMETFPKVLQVPIGKLREEGFAMRGRWHEDFFGNSNPIVLELGCGRGEYTVGLAREYPDRNFIGIDIKGARMWAGAKEAHLAELDNVGFLRTNIELLSEFFAPREVSEIWITFPDPQMKKTRKRLTATNFLQMYRSILQPDGIVNLKTDSPFLFEYTSRLIDLNKLPVVKRTDDLYANPEGVDRILNIHTHYENQWLARGLTIKYIAFRLTDDQSLAEPETDDIELDSYRSYGRHYNYDNLPESDS
ncbi:MAG: tRNA (guanosine(46)-N7)-methyltransferase TrmB [Bacteroides sp.]|nr:tRNA (guanosine(46)-N7)-methyltransferase TrmB [Bacteroides sp.]MCM1379514.1 tRNA (guanosine(46)-N7)-methyltransferase TrmB [Bacteroides sp.]MCM1445883.1 tRNA (guanosine(46)-N7)-methyltransferase TrmB [Prevotella sp.]